MKGWAFLPNGTRYPVHLETEGARGRDGMRDLLMAPPQYQAIPNSKAK